MLKQSGMMLTELPSEPDIDNLIRGRIDHSREIVVVPDNIGAAPSLDALIRAQNWVSPDQRVCIILNTRDRNRIALASRYLSAAHMGIHSIILDTGIHTRQGPLPDARPVYDVDPIQAARFLNQFRLKSESNNQTDPSIGVRIAIQQIDNFELERMGRICRSGPNFLVLKSNLDDLLLSEWIKHCECVDGFTDIDLFLEIPHGSWDNRRDIEIPQNVCGLSVRY